MAESIVTQKEARQVVDTLVQKIEQHFAAFNISEIIEGGSMGHGTPVLDNYDIDLVIYSRDISGIEIREEGSRGCTKWLEKLRDFLKTTYGRDYQDDKHHPITTRSIQFRFRQLIDVDLLISPYWRDQHELYRFLAGLKRTKTERRENKKHPRERFTVCASKWQVEFFSEFLTAHPQVRHYIIKAKEWRNENWPPGGCTSGRPSSYLMSLLVIKAYQRNKKRVTRSLIQLVQSAGRRFNVTWGKLAYYQRRDYPTLLPSRPRVLDPANPANNVWVSGLQDYEGGVRPSDYEPGDGNSTVLKRIIHTIKLN